MRFKNKLLRRCLLVVIYPPFALFLFAVIICREFCEMRLLKTICDNQIELLTEAKRIWK
jgi:hypothetical protein